MMVQPKTPPVSFRPGDERLARIEAFAAEHKLSRHLAILVLIDAGLNAPTLSAEARFKLDAIKAAAGGTDAALNAAILAWNGPGEPKPVVEKPPVKRAAHDPEAATQIAETWGNPKPARKDVAAQPLRLPRAAPGSRLKGGKK